MYQRLNLRARGSLSYTTLAFCLAILALQSCQSDPNSPPDDPPINPPVDTTVVSYITPQSSELIKDTRIRQSAPTQTQGGISTLKVGDLAGTVLDLLLMDSSVVFLDSIPAGSEIIACTLWIKVGQLQMQNSDIVSLDLWSVPETWNENETSWNNRTATQTWQTPGVGGLLIDSQLVRLEKLNLFDFVWTVHGQMYDTVRVENAQFLPVPIPVTLAAQNYLGQSFGFALRVNPATSQSAIIGIVSAEAVTVGNRPIVEWRYR